MKYSEPLQSQAEVVLVFFGVGFLLGLWYLLCKFFRRLCADSKVGTFLLDLLFCFGAFFALFACFLAYTNGIWRLPALAAAAGGLILFQLSFGRLLWRLLEPIADLIRRSTMFLLEAVNRLSRAIRSRLCSLATKLKALSEKGKRGIHTAKEKNHEKRKKSRKST